MCFQTFVINIFYYNWGIRPVVVYFYFILKVRKMTDKIFIFIIIQGI